MWPLLLAIALQSADAAYTCRTLAQGGREANPLLPNSCAGIVAVKASLIGLTFAVPQPTKTHIRVGLAVAGGAGLGLSITLSRRSP